jgi:hypothetical protein
MTYKNRLKCLLSLIAVLALLYTGSLVFNSGFVNSRSSFYTWLDSRAAGRVNRIVINSQGESLELVKRNNIWFVLHNGNEYPARQMRVEDFLSIFTTRSVWSVRSSSASTHERFGLDRHADRVTVYGENTVLLDLLLGDDDSTGRESYFRGYGQNEVRSGDNKIRTYITGPVTGWYNLRLIPESEGGNIVVDDVQRLSVYTAEETQFFSRGGRRWIVSGIAVTNPDQNAIENYIRTILNVEGDNFVDSISGGDPQLNYSRIVLEFGDGSVITIRLSEADETGRIYAHVSGRDYVYSIPAWAAGRLFREPSSFETR